MHLFLFINVYSTNMMVADMFAGSDSVAEQTDQRAATTKSQAWNI